MDIKKQAQSGAENSIDVEILILKDNKIFVINGADDSGNVSIEEVVPRYGFDSKVHGFFSSHSFETMDKEKLITALTLSITDGYCDSTVIDAINGSTFIHHQDELSTP